MLSEQQFYLFGQIQKDENKQKEAGRGPFCKRKRLPASVLGSQSKCLRWYWQEKGRDLHTLNPRDRWTDRKTGKQCDMYGMQMMMKKGILTNLGGKRECKRFFWTFRDKSFASKKRQIFEGFFWRGAAPDATLKLQETFFPFSLLTFISIAKDVHSVEYFFSGVKHFMFSVSLKWYEPLLKELSVERLHIQCYVRLFL